VQPSGGPVPTIKELQEAGCESLRALQAAAGLEYKNHPHDFTMKPKYMVFSA
jgi:hypothetical protein